MLVGEKIRLRFLVPEDVGPEYAAWMNDPAVNRYLESRWRPWTVETLRDWVRGVVANPGDHLFGIFLPEGRHIGNIKIGNVNQVHRYADVGIVVGGADARGRGVGSEAIALASAWALAELGLNKLMAGLYAENIGSLKAFLKAGYQEAGRFSRHRLCAGRYVDEIVVELLGPPCREP